MILLEVAVVVIVAATSGFVIYLVGLWIIWIWEQSK